MTIFEYISGIVLGGAVAIHISSVTHPLLHGIVAIVSWTFFIVCIDTLALKSKRFRDFVNGKGKVLITHGSFIYDHLKKERMTRDELLENLRTRNIDQLSDVEFALLEPSGKLNIRTYDSGSASAHHEDLTTIHKKVQKLIKHLEERTDLPQKKDVEYTLKKLHIVHDLLEKQTIVRSEDDNL